ncbi:hypothetical protein MKW94_010967, partial [Papaver nudicaule]|nr:hypothetical protein [Papaver nudicaule]
EAEKKHKEERASNSGKRQPAKPVSRVPSAAELLKDEKSVLAKAKRYLELLEKASPESLETHILSFELNMRRKKLNRAHKVMHA